MKEVEFILHRRYLGKEYTIGKFSLNDFRICDTIEDPVRDYNKDGDLLDAGETKIFGETAIPYGRYRMIVVDSPKFKRRLPYLQNVKHFKGILIHSGNEAKDTHGCIIPGENLVKGKVLNSRHWEKLITAMIDRFIETGHEVYLKII
jgi:hypothetical protein